MLLESFDFITSKENFYIAQRNTLRGEHKYHRDAMEFNKDGRYNLEQLRQSLISNTYKPSTYEYFVVKDPKEREIYAPKYSDKIVHHAINNYMADEFKYLFIPNTFACIKERGNHLALNALMNVLKETRLEYGEDCYCVNIDVEKFFFNIDHDLLKVSLSEVILDPRTLNLFNVIIDHSPTNPGIPLGNLMSQSLANFTLDPLDQLFYNQYEHEYYIRYMDDIYIIARNEREASNVLDFVRNYLKDNLKLSIHPEKSRYFRALDGFDALGFKVYPDHMELLETSKRRILERLECLRTNPHDIIIKELEDSINGWLNFAKQADVDNFVNYLIESFPGLYLNNGGRFVINPRVLGRSSSIFF